GKFRYDLYYRLSVFTITLPSLKERTADIPVLVKHFVALQAAKLNMSVPKIDDSYIDRLQKHSWKRNDRELKNSIERSLILIEGDTLDANALPYEFCMQEGTSNSLSAMALAEIERKHIQKVLAFTKGNKAEAARLLEIGVATLYRKIEEYKI